jgi:hypothetical protein
MFESERNDNRNRWRGIIMEINVEILNSWIAKYNGEYSTLYPLIKNKLDSHNFTVQELAFPGNFLFYEKYYFVILRHLLECKRTGTVLDIGCELGIQSELFLHTGFEYIGIEYFKYNYLNQDKCKYINGTYPFVDVESEIIISCMSLGYFDFYLKDVKDVRATIYNKLSKAKHLYIIGDQSFVQGLFKYFKSWIILKDKVYYFSK